MKLTAKAVEAIKPATERKEIPDQLLRGLYLVVQPSGAKSWAVRYRNGGRTRKATIGPFPAVDLKAARELGAKALRAAAEGRDPGAEKKKEKASSVDDVVAQFLERYCERNLRSSTRNKFERFIRAYVLPRWSGRSIGSITRSDVRDMLDKLIAEGKTAQTNRVFSMARKLLNWCAEQEIIAASPIAGMRRLATETSRDRTLSDDELRAVWQAADKIGYPVGDAVKMLILSGQRRGEVGAMEWRELNLNERLWKLPRERVKNDRAHDVPLSPQAISIIENAPRTSEQFVFSIRGCLPLNDFAKHKRRLDALLPPDMKPWVLHDIRRSVASGMAKLGISLPVIERVLNHVSGSFAGIVGVYQHHQFVDEKRRALEAWGNHVAALIAPNVVPLHRSAG